MKAKGIAGLAFAGLAAVALLLAEGSPLGAEATVDRIVQAPEPESPPQSGNGEEHAESTMDEKAANGSWSPSAVGFTMRAGKLYLVTADSDGAARLASSVIDDGGTPLFRCGDDAAPGGSGDENGFTALELRAYGGSGALPPLSQDGRLLETQQDGPRLPCSLTDVGGD